MKETDDTRILLEANRTQNNWEAERGFMDGAEYENEYLTIRLHHFITYLCDTHVIDCSSVEDVMAQWSENKF